MKERKYLSVDEIESIRGSCSADEREICLTKSDNDLVWSVFVSDNKMLTKLKKIMKSEKATNIKCWESGRDSDGYVMGYFFELPVDCIHFRAGKGTRKKSLTEEERKAIGARFRAGRIAKMGLQK